MAFGSGTIEKIADDIYSSLLKSSKKSLSSIDLFKRKRKKYFDNISSNHSHIRILGMSKPMRIQDLYIPVRVSEEIGSRKYLDEQYLEYINRQKKVPSAIQHELNRISKGERLNAINVIKNGQFFIILGGPGSGKTTLMKYLLLYYADKIQTNEVEIKNPLFPILVAFRDAIEEKISISNLILKQLEIAGIPEAKIYLKSLLASGNCILLFDGFDELPAGKQPTYSKQLHELCQRHPDNRYVLSSRTTEHLTRLENFTELEICDFTETEIKSFVSNWFSSQSKLSKGRELSRRILEDAHLRELSATPLLLSLICILYKYDLRIPTNRYELYKRCIECLLREWDTDRDFRRETKFEKFSDERKIQFFSMMSHSLFTKDQLFFKREVILKLLSQYLGKLDISETESDYVLREIMSHHGIIVKRSPQIYSFSHLTFQEYFVANYLITTNSFYDIVKYSNDPKWHEVIVLIASSLYDASTFVHSAISFIDTKYLSILAQRGSLGYGAVLLRSIALSEVRLSESIRAELYNLYFSQHLSVYKIPWSSINLEWRFSPKASKTFIKASFDGLRTNKKLSITNAINSFRNTLDTLSLSPSMLRYYSSNCVPNEYESKNVFAIFTSMVSKIIEHGGGYDLKLL